MTHRQQLIAMLEEAGIDFGYSDGDCIVTNGCVFRFYANGSLRETDREWY